MASIATSPAYTPYITQINSVPLYGNKLPYSIDRIRKLLANHVNNAKQLRNISDYLYNLNGLYRRLIDTFINIINFDYVIVPMILDDEKFNEKIYKNKKNKIRQYMWNCNFEVTMNDILFKLAKYGRYTAFDRGSYLQPLPLDYTRIIGIADDGNPLIQFDFSYFDEIRNVRERNMQLKGFDPIFRKKYLDYKNGVDNPNENFTGELNWRLLPPEKTYTFKIGSNLESPEGLGVFYGLIDDIIFYDEVRDLDRQIISSKKRKIVVQTIPVDKEGNSILGEEEITKMHNNIKNLLPENVGILTVLGGTKYDSIPLELSALDTNKMKEVQNDLLLSSGIGDGALKGGNFSTGVLNIDVLTSTIIKILKQIETQWFNRKFNQLVPNKQYSFKLKFIGMTSFNKDKIIDQFDGLLDKGGSLSPSIAARGFNIDEYMDMLSIEESLKFKNKFKPLQTSYTVSNKKPGRESGSGEGSDNTDRSNENGGNNNPKPSKQ